MQERVKRFFKKEKAWLFLFAITFLSAGYMTVVAGIQLNTFLHLDRDTISIIDSLEITPNGKKFFLLARYSYSVKDKVFSSKTAFTSSLFLNRLSAKRSLAGMENKKNMQLWYMSKDPSFSSLEKIFPVKKLLYATISWMIIFYFFWLRNRVKNFL